MLRPHIRHFLTVGSIPGRVGRATGFLGSSGHKARTDAKFSHQPHIAPREAQCKTWHTADWVHAEPTVTELFL